MSRIKEIESKIRNLHQELKKALQTEFGLSFDPIFKKYPWLSSVSYTQYTPSWNDGETCYFGVYADEPELTTSSDIDEQSAEYEKCIDECSNLIFSFETDTLELLGEGEVTINRNLEVEVHDCDHD